MTAAEKNTYIKNWHRFQQRYERIYTVKFKAALQEQIHQYKIHRHITAEPIHRVLVDLYKTVGPLWAAKTGIHKLRPKRTGLTVPVQLKARMPMGFSERIIELMRQYLGVDLLNIAEQITDYTRKVISGILSANLEQGLSINEVVRELEANTELGTMRARRIARTETVSASNSASIVNAKETGVPMRKIWLAVNDQRTRHSHKEVDDVTIPIDDTFTVGGVQMMQPGAKTQPNGLETPAEQVVNCRCTLGYEVIQ